MNTDLTQLEDAIKRVIMVTYLNTRMDQPPERVISDLNKIFARKAKVFTNLARWAAKQAERGQPATKAVQSLSFYAHVLGDFRDKNINQPLSP